MKKYLLNLILFIACSSISIAQPSSFNYQSVIRDADGNILQNESIMLKTSIVNESANVFFSETHNATTDNFGQIQIAIGGGELLTGNIETCPWGTEQLLLKVELSNDGGTTYETMGQSPLLGVPYAFYSASGDPGPPGNGIESVTDNGDGTLTFHFTDNSSYTTPNLAGPTLNAEPGNLIYMDTAGWVATEAIRIAGNKVAIGDTPTLSRLMVKGDSLAGANDPIFEVKNKDGAVVFAVYENGVEIYVDDSGTKRGVKGGFAVGGLTDTKASGKEYFRVTPDSVRIYLREDTVKGVKGGFAVGGLTDTKAKPNEYLKITPDSTRIYVKQNAKGVKGGFAVGGLTDTKGTAKDLLHVSPDSVRIYIDKSAGKGVKGGFAVGGLTDTKGQNTQFFNVEFDTTQTIDPSEPRILYYPVKNAFLAGQVLIESPDSVGKNSFSSGVENKAVGFSSMAMGVQSISRGQLSTAIGYRTVASNTLSFAFGNNSQASGQSSYALGSYSKAIGHGSFALGYYEEEFVNFASNPTIAYGPFSFALGIGAIADDTASIAIGVNARANGMLSTAFGFESHATGYNSLAFGGSTQSKGINSMAIGFSTIAEGTNSMALGFSTIAEGTNSFAFGTQSSATAEFAFSLGNNANTGNTQSYSFGNTITNDGAYSFAMGTNVTIANGATASFAVGNNVSIGSFAQGSFTMGNNIVNNSKGSFVFGDGSNSISHSVTKDNSFVVRSTGGFDIFTTTDYTNGISVSSGGGSWNTISDKNKKENYTKLNSEDIYNKLLQLPVERWNYKSQSPDIMHIGTYSQDFYRLFQVGESELTITWMDPVGVNTIAIQHQAKLIEQQQEEIKALKKQIEEIKELIK
jgi:hypothetical protein